MLEGTRDSAGLRICLISFCQFRTYGKQLWDHAVRVARGFGLARMILVADLHAEPFYQPQGAIRVSSQPSLAGFPRPSPLMELRLAPCR